MPCWRSNDCLEDKTVEVSVVVSGLDASALSGEERDALGAALASDLASACEVANSSVVELSGASNATVTFGPGGGVSAFVRDLSGITAQDLAARLYSSSFRATLGNTTEGVVGSAAGVQVASVSFEPKAFSPVTTSTTSTQTTTVATTSAGAVATEDTTQRYHDFRPTDQSGAGALAAPAWLAVVCAVAMS